MNKNICYIVGAGTNYGLDFTPKAGDYVIAADGGLDHLHKQGMAADLSIGDFDSILIKPAQGNIITLNKDKDYTDTYESVQKGMSKGYNTFYIYCGTGGRPDHTFANIQLLGYLAQNNKHGYLIDENYIITAIKNGNITFSPDCQGYISVFSYSDTAAGVSIKGLKYELEDHSLSSAYPIGVSNEFIGITSTISVKSGTLIITFPRECMPGIIVSGVVAAKA